MKKALAVIVLALAPALSYAELQLGAAGLYNGDIAGLGSQQFDMTYGLEARFKFFSVVQIGLTALYYYPSTVAGPSYIQTLADVGISIDIFFLRFGAGIGPDFFIPMSGPSVSATSAANLKFSGDVNIGPVALGIVAFYPVQSVWDLPRFTSMKPWVGLAILVKLF